MISAGNISAKNLSLVLLRVDRIRDASLLESLLEEMPAGINSLEKEESHV